MSEYVRGLFDGYRRRFPSDVFLYDVLGPKERYLKRAVFRMNASLLLFGPESPYLGDEIAVALERDNVVKSRSPLRSLRKFPYVINWVTYAKHHDPFDHWRSVFDYALRGAAMNRMRVIRHMLHELKPNERCAYIFCNGTYNTNVLDISLLPRKARRDKMSERLCEEFISAIYDYELHEHAVDSWWQYRIDEQTKNVYLAARPNALQIIRAEEHEFEHADAHEPATYSERNATR